MEMGKIPLFGMLTDRMNWLSTRQSLLSENVSNAATPNYQARDLSPVDFAAEMTNSSGLSSTNVRHFKVGSGGPPSMRIVSANEGGTPGGNAVSLEQEMIKLSETQIQFQTAVNLYQKAVNMFRTAIGGRGQ
jgi:flagellar basal-body rod protein FlgB